jgi:carboxypeptidase C (cathepsin A)
MTCLYLLRRWSLVFLIPIPFTCGVSAAVVAAESGKEKPQEEKSNEIKEVPPVVTEHSVTLPGGKTLNYKAVTGYMLIRDTKGEVDKEGEKGASKLKPDPIDPSKGKPKAQIFFTAYLLKDVADPASRPVTYAFNGGPGSASLWLQIGAIGPRRVALSDRGEALPPPAKIVDNEATWLDKTDLVFIDPVSTGFSRPVPGEDAKQFYGYKEDVESIGNFIRLWTTRYSRWASPKFIAGES